LEIVFSGLIKFVGQRMIGDGIVISGVCVCVRYVIYVFPHRYDLFFVVQCWLCGWLRLFFAGVEMNTIRKWLPSWKLMYASEIRGSTAVSMPRDVYSYVDMFVIVDMPINITILY